MCLGRHRWMDYHLPAAAIVTRIAANDCHIHCFAPSQTVCCPPMGIPYGIADFLFSETNKVLLSHVTWLRRVHANGWRIFCQKPANGHRVKHFVVSILVVNILLFKVFQNACWKLIQAVSSSIRCSAHISCELFHKFFPRRIAFRLRWASFWGEYCMRRSAWRGLVVSPWEAINFFKRGFNKFRKPNVPFCTPKGAQSLDLNVIPVCKQIIVCFWQIKSHTQQCYTV